MTGELFNELKDQIDKTFDETFISLANQEFLDIHSKERRYSRISYGTPPVPETLENWANRVRRIKYNRTSANILLNLESITPILNAEVVWDYPDGVLTGSGDKRTDDLLTDYPAVDWGNYGPLDMKKRFRCFSVVLETPIPPPLAHFDNKQFFDDGAFMDTRIRTFDDNTAFAIKELVKKKCPAGSSFRLLVKGFTGLTIGDEASQELDINT